MEDAWTTRLAEMSEFKIYNMDHNIGAVILYTTNDDYYLKLCVNNLLESGIKTIAIVSYTHMWNGTPENQELIQQVIDTYKNDSRINFVQLKWQGAKDPFYYENLGREVGSVLVEPACEYILYVDVDEIVEPVKFKSWLSSFNYRKYKGIYLKQHVYFKEAIYRVASSPQTIPVLFKSSCVYEKRKGNARRRYMNYDSKLSRWLTKAGLHPRYHIQDDGSCFIHHYAWVRTKEQLVKKTENWGHRDDRVDWKKKINDLFETDDMGDGYITVDNIFNIDINYK